MTKLMIYNKNSFYISIFAILAFISTSTGFDFYSHSVSYYFYNETINYSDIIITYTPQPRYLLLSIIYEFFSRIGLPLGYVALFLIAFPVYHISKHIEPKVSVSGSRAYSIYQISVLFFVIFSSFFYSGLSISLLWIFAAVLSKKKIFLLGGLFHPIAILLSIVLFSFSNRRLLFVYIGYLVIFYIFLYLSSVLNIFTSFGYDNIGFSHESISLVDLFIQVIERKSEEIKQLILVGILIFFIFKGFKRKNPFGLFIANTFGIGNRIFIKILYVRIVFLSMVVVLHVYMLQKQTLLNSIFTFNIVNPIYISWFDWGSKDLKINYDDLYYQRYRNGEGY